MKPNEFKKFEKRDAYCVHCGLGNPYLVPHHRKNRGMGGSKQLDNPANILLVCAEINGLMESDSKIAKMARDYGWKLQSWQDPLAVLVYNAYNGKTYKLDDEYNKTII